jgi:Zn finger protein HypA/HybF involved in hydrogenase expression
MHETRFAEEIITRIKARIKEVGKKEIDHIVVRVGLSPLSHVTSEGLNHAVDGLLSVNGLKKVKLSIKPIEFKVKCRTCGAKAAAVKPVFACPVCDGPDFEVKIDPEFTVDSVDVR